jgi:hypothetical protein
VKKAVREQLPRHSTPELSGQLTEQLAEVAKTAPGAVVIEVFSRIERELRQIVVEGGDAVLYALRTKP